MFYAFLAIMNDDDDDDDDEIHNVKFTWVNVAQRCNNIWLITVQNFYFYLSAVQSILAVNYRRSYFPRTLCRTYGELIAIVKTAMCDLGD